MAAISARGQTPAPQAGTRRYARFRRPPHGLRPQPDGLILSALFSSCDRRFRQWLGARGRIGQWAVLLALSVVCFALLEAVHLPAALLLGPMMAAMLLAASEIRVRVPHKPFLAAQAMIGCLIARGLPPSILPELRKDWLVFAAVVVLVVGVSTALGWLLAKWQVLPGTTAVWGASPGAAAAMTLMSDAYGADMRLVAFMQYQRVVLVATLASVVSAIWAAGTGGVPEMVWFPAVNWPALAETVAVAGLGAVLGAVLRIPAGALLVPLGLGIVLQGVGWLTIELPPWLLAVSYALLGWTIGLRFTRAILAHAARAMPQLVAALLTLVALCGGLAVLLVVTMDIDPLTAYLATSPGGADSVAIIAASTPVDVPFVMAMQASRLLVVMLAGPALTRFVARRIERAAKGQPTPSALSEP